MMNMLTFLYLLNIRYKATDNMQQLDSGQVFVTVCTAMAYCWKVRPPHLLTQAIPSLNEAFLNKQSLQQSELFGFFRDIHALHAGLKASTRVLLPLLKHPPAQLPQQGGHDWRNHVKILKDLLNNFKLRTPIAICRHRFSTIRANSEDGCGYATEKLSQEAVQAEEQSECTINEVHGRLTASLHSCTETMSKACLCICVHCNKK